MGESFRGEVWLELWYGEMRIRKKEKNKNSIFNSDFLLRSGIPSISARAML